MENRVENSDGVEIPKKKRSLDLKSLYKSRDSEEASDKKNYKILERKHRIDGVDDDSDGERRKKRKKESKSDSRKEVSVNSFEHVGKKSRKSLDELYSGGLSSGSGDLEKTRLGLSQRLGNGSSTSTGLSQPLNRISLSLDDNVRIPKGRRGFARRKKFDGNNVSKVVGPSSVKESVTHHLGKVTGDSGSQADSHSHLEPSPCDDSAKVKQRKFDGDQVTELEGPSCGKDAVVDQLGKLAGDSVTGLDSSSRITAVKVKRRRGSADTKDKKSRGSNGSLTVHNLKEDGIPIAHSDSSSRKSRKKHRKGMDVAADNQRFSKEAKPSVDNFDGLLEDDEENLEQNAARMLSSRFDPNCTGFSSDRKASPSLLRNRLSLSTYSGPGFTSRQITSLASSESVSVDAAGMVLRPRKQHREKSLSRKRRHFYEILFTDIDADWVLNRRIKVFWPLDKSWYYGLVNDYDPERKLHHVKYDDRDEEWINLQNERFKLLLFPSEVPGKSGRKKLVLGDRYAEGEKGDMTMEDDSYLGSFMDSEPIISWLARSTHRVKSSPFGYLKKKKTSLQCLDNKSPVLSDKTVNSSLSLSVRHSKSEEKKTSNASSTVRFSDDREEKSVSGNNSLPRDVKLPIVYFRRRFRQRGQEHGHIVRDDHVCRSGPESVTPVERHETSEEHNITLELPHCSGPLWHIDNSGLLKLTIPVRDSRQFRLEISLPVIPPLHYLSRGETFWLFRTLLLLQYGAVITMWSNVHLEMLFVDNIVGLRFFCFKGCLQQAVAFIFFVLTLFLQRNEQGRYYDLQMPVTSVRFKLSCSHSFGKQLVFAFSNFCKVKSSKWLYLDFKLKRHCLIAKQLPLSECTYDNIEALQSGHNQLVLTTVCDPSSTEVLPKQFRRQGTICTGASRESTSMNKSQFSCSYKERLRQIPPFSLSFTAAPTFFLGLHLKLLMERSVSHISFPDHDLMPSQGHANNSGRLIVEDGSLVDVCSNIGSVITSGDSLSTSRDAACSLLSCVYPRLGADALAECGNVGYRKPSKYQNGHLNNAETSSSSQDNADDEIYDAVQWQSHHSESNQFLPRDLVIGDRSSPDRSGSGCHSRSVGISVDIPPFNQVENHVDRRTLSAHRSTTLAWNMNDGVIRSPNPTGPRTMWHRTRSISSSSSFGYLSNVWPDGKDEFYRNGFNSGPKKPRTQVSYTLPFGGVEFSSKHRTRSQQQKGIAHRRIRRANEKKTLDGSRSSQRNLESLSCDANVLITLGDRGWRECGARIVLEYVDRNEWRLAVKLSGSTKYSYKAHQFLQPGSTNRYTHAMMWKGGKDWILEFPDRSQWTLFKDMHEECYNRNIRAASVKNIPIPGVHLIEESDDIGTEMGFVRSSSKYFRQVETDVDLALDPSHILYDMDSDDEQWILENQSISDTKKSITGEISDELFEKIMDMFEKAAYSQQRDQFTLEEIEELMFGVGPLDLIKIMYDYWLQKRQRKGMPLIRQLQPPLWERYQQQIKDWEFATTKANSALPNGCQEKAAVIEKPPMFAFCLKPRGLEVPNKGSKQRSHRKVPVSGQSNSIFGDHDGYHPFGRRINGFAFGDEKIPSPGYSHEFSEASPYFQTSRAFSPRDAATGYVLMSSDGFERNHHPKLHRTKSKKIGSFPSQNDPQLVGSFNQRTIGNRTGVQRWNMGLPEWPSHKSTQSDGPLRPSMEQLDSSVHDEFRLRDASGAAQHALNMAKLKREKAQRLLYRADLAIHKAVVALMTAEAIKASSEDSIGDG